MLDVISNLIFIVLAALGISYQILVQINLILCVGSVGLLVLSMISLIRTINRQKRKNASPQ
jgi:TRAP-type C4-dicarboxylate transport system permease small subunit